MSALKEVLGLLAPGDEPASEGESYLVTSILQATGPLDGEAKTLVESSGGENDLGLLVEVIAACPTQTVVQNFTKWSQILMLALQTAASPSTLQLAHRGLHSLLHSVSSSAQSLDKLTLQAVSPLVQSLLSFSAPSTTPPLQAMALRLVSHCLVHFNSSCSQHRQALRKWAGSAVFHTHSHLSQEASRVLVLLCRHSNQQWGHLMGGVVGGAQWVLRRLHRTGSKSGNKSEREELPGSATTAWLALPTVPPAHPERTGVLLQMLTQLARMLCYCLLFPPRDSAHAPRDSSHLPSVPVESVLTLVSEGLKPAASGHTVEALVLQVAIPVVHAAMWNILCVLVETCHAHLLPYGPHIQWLLVTAICNKDAAQSPRLLTAVHRTLAVWVGVVRDCETSFLTTIFHSLLGTCDHAPLRQSSLQTLATLVTLVGPLVTPPLATPTLKLVMEGLSPSLAPSQAVPLLHLLKACLSSGNTDLTPPPSAAIRLLTDLANHHTAAEVVSLSHSCLHQLSNHICHAPSQTSSTTEAPPTSAGQHSQATPLVLPLVPHLQAPPTSPSPADLMTLVQNQRRSKRSRPEELDVVSDSKRKGDHQLSKKQSQEESSSEEVPQTLKSLDDVDTSRRLPEDTDDGTPIEVEDKSLGGEDKTLGNGGGEVRGENSLLREELEEVGSSSDSDGEGSGVDYFVADSPTSSE